MLHHIDKHNESVGNPDDKIKTSVELEKMKPELGILESCIFYEMYSFLNIFIKGNVEFHMKPYFYLFDRDTGQLGRCSFSQQGLCTVCRF